MLILTGIAVSAASPENLPNQAPDQIVRFQGIRPTDPHGRDGLRNPDRGLRIETLIAEPAGSKVWGPAHHLKDQVPSGYTDQWWIQDCQRYAPHGLTLAQTYCYLDQFINQPLSAEKLALLQQSLDQLRAHGLKSVLRFAYEKDMNRQAGPVLETILNHLKQLAPIIQTNADVISVMQAGFVGAWGEWHSSAHGLEKDHGALARIVAQILQVLPPERMTQVRVPKYKRWVLNDPLLGGFEKISQQTAHSTRASARIGFNNDGFLAGTTCGGTWPEPPHFSNPGNPEFDYMTQESAFVPVDGELFWSDQGGKIDGMRAAVRLRLHHYTSFSLAHSFSEREGKSYSIDAWMQTPLTLSEIQNAKLPVSDGYFENSQGKETPRTQFEYIRDHLGYRLELQQAQFALSIPPGSELPVRLELINRGFSTLHHPRPLFLVLMDEKTIVQTHRVTDCDPRSWQPYAPDGPDFQPLIHTIFGRISLDNDLTPGRYRLGLWMPDHHPRLRNDARYAVRVANRDVRWWTDAQGQYGVNVLGSLEVLAPRQPSSDR